MSTYSLLHTPPLTTSPPLTLSDLPTHNIKYIRIYWLDWTSQLRLRVLPLAHFTRLITTTTPPGLCIPKVTLGMWDLHLAPGVVPVGEYFYEFDLATMRLDPVFEGLACVMGWIREKTSAGGVGVGVGVVESSFCQRSMLKRVVDDASSKGLTYLIGFETEFILLKKTPEGIYTPIHMHSWSSASALMAGSLETTVLQEIAEGIQRAGVVLEVYHPEAGPGQYEVVTGPLPPLEAADALVITREIIYNVANKHGLRATMAPRIYLDNCGSGAHAHISVHPSPTLAASLPPPAPPPTLPNHPAPALTAPETHLLAGILENFPALCAFLMPTPASYARVVDGVWSGGTYVCWGVDNKESVVRVCGPEGGRHFEIKLTDATSTPYLVLASLLGTCTHSILTRTPLRFGDVSPGLFLSYTAAEQAALGYGAGRVVRVPATLGEARTCLRGEGGRVVRGVFEGFEGFEEEYLRVNEFIEHNLMEGTEAERTKRLIENW